MSEYTVTSFPPERALVVDAGYMGTGRHIIYGLLEVDITKPRALMKSMAPRGAVRMSFTAFIVASLAKAIESAPKVQALRDWRGRLVIFNDVDVVTMIEPEPGKVAIPHIIREANQKSFLQINDEIRAVQGKPESSQQGGKLVSLAPKLPRFVRLFFFWVVKKNPFWFRSLEGTVVVTSVGMFGKGGGWGIGFLPSHNLGVTVGGIAQKPIIVDGQLVEREFLNLTLSFDHDIVDGAPAARFAKRFTELIENGSVLEQADV